MKNSIDRAKHFITGQLALVVKTCFFYFLLLIYLILKCCSKNHVVCRYDLNRGTAWFQTGLRLCLCRRRQSKYQSVANVYQDYPAAATPHVSSNYIACK